MDKTELIMLVGSLYASMPGISDYQVPRELPEVHMLPRAVLQDLVCGRPCQIRAIYHPDFGLLIDETLDGAGNLYDRSIVFHELVHHAQHMDARFTEMHRPCERRAAAEREAYSVQNRYLAANGSSDPVPVLNWFRLCEKQETQERVLFAVD
jgi:hypothetical protein